MKNSPYKAEILLLLNLAMAFSMLFSSSLSRVYSALIAVYGLYWIFSKKNKDGAAHLMAAYVIGVEVLFRMNSGGFFYEWGKYTAIMFLLFGLFVGGRKQVPAAFLFLIFLLFPSLINVDFSDFDFARQLVSFNISGPIMLGVSAIYFYRRRFTPAQLRKLLLAMLYPIVAMSVFVYFRAGSLENVEFHTESNFEASGGFGPNQVSTIFGLGILIIALAYFLGIRLFRVRYLEVLLLLGLLVRGLATFSRGGMLAPAVAIVVTMIIMTSLDSRFKQKLNRAVFAFIAVFVVAFFGFYYVNEVSGGLLEMRFKGQSMYDEDKNNLLSGREEIFNEDLEIFQKNMLMGVGPGMAEMRRADIGGVEVSAHIEYSRLLAEHGLFGIFVIIIMVSFPIVHFFRLKSTDDRIILVMCTAFVFFTLGHAAMRTAAPGFVYGIAFLHLMRKPPR